MAVIKSIMQKPALEMPEELLEPMVCDQTLSQKFEALNIRGLPKVRRVVQRALNPPPAAASLEERKKRGREVGEKEAATHLEKRIAGERGAFEYFLARAERQGLADDQYTVGCSFLNGRGVERNFGKAIEWLEKAAQQGHELAGKQLADLMPK